MFSPSQLATYFVVSATAAMFCIIAIWSATSRRHWFLRFTLPLAALAILLPIQAHEPVIYFALVMGEIVLVIFGSRIWKARRSKQIPLEPSKNGAFRFGLADLMLAMIPAAIVAWIFSQFAGVGLLIDWPDAFFASILLSVIALLVWGGFASRWKWAASTLALIAIIVAALIDTFLLGDWLSTGEFFGFPKSLMPSGFFPRFSFFLLFLWIYAQSAMLMLIGLAIVAIFSLRDRRTIWRVIVGIAALPPVALLAWVYWQMLGVSEIPANPYLPGNAYPQVLSLAKRNERAGPLEAADIRRELLELLDQPAGVTLDWSRAASDPVSADDTSAIMLYRNLSRSIQAEAEKLHAAGQHDEAARYELALLRLGTTHLRGGLTIHALTGIAVDGVAIALLARHRTEYSPSQSQKIMAELAMLERFRETPAAIMKRDRAFQTTAWRWRPRLYWAINRLFFGESFEGLAAPANNMLRHLYLRQHTDEQLLLADLAIRLFHHDRRRWPVSLDDLVPDYLPDVPKDPYADAPLIYRPGGDGVILYSVGKDGRDDGGVFGTRLESMKPGFDIDLDPAAR